MITLRGIVWIVLLINIVSVKPKPVNDGDSDNDTNVCDNDKQCGNKSSNKDNILSSVISLFTENTQKINDEVQDAIGGLNFLNHFPSLIKRRDTASLFSAEDNMHAINKRSVEFNETEENGNSVSITRGLADDNVSKTTIVDALTEEDRNMNTATVSKIGNPVSVDMQSTDIIDVREVQNGTDLEVVIENNTQDDNILPINNDGKIMNEPNISLKDIQTDNLNHTTDSDIISNIAINNNTLFDIDNKLSTVISRLSVTDTAENNPALYINSSTEINEIGNETTARTDSSVLIYDNVTQTESLTLKNDSSNTKNVSENAIYFPNSGHLDSEHLYDAPENYNSTKVDSEKKTQDNSPEYKNSNSSSQDSLLSNNPDLEFSRTDNSQNNILQLNKNGLAILNKKHNSGNLMTNNNISRIDSTLLNLTIKEVMTKGDETVNDYMQINDKDKVSNTNSLNTKSNSYNNSSFDSNTVTVDDNVSVNNNNYNKTVTNKKNTTVSLFQSTDMDLKPFNSPKNIIYADPNNSTTNKITNDLNHTTDKITAIDANNEEAKELDSNTNNFMPNFNGRPPRVKVHVDFFVDDFTNFATSPKKYLENKIAQLFVPQN